MRHDGYADHEHEAVTLGCGEQVEGVPGRHLADRAFLLQLAKEVGLDAQTVEQALAGDGWAAEVRADEQEAARLGVRGVPFFVFDRRFAVSGAQPQETFRMALEKAWAERAQGPGTSK